MGLGMTGDRELGPPAPPETFVPFSSAPDIVTTDMASLHARGIHDDLRLFFDEFEFLGLVEDNA
jgi:hypothetical protein